ncbi:RNA 2',3'-cyclic phosphodiesterase [Actinoplanes sp. NBRC 103695]|uniref:RNA 2',3'-cyclic phosphodiesterase n=1 Tax=Actinoplanes sp. NBRC 103695 TaxID=3032202 RepID=UPI0024A1E695|nr:RNA 2',3'-cyclic phosphodiesterase [Actinoplanes sp. NBRC 103695]GLY98159.1 RNA 2',3'-cyclic phosphodiesterase [Actinoplanes sp. NBRC 103695]
MRLFAALYPPEDVCDELRRRLRDVTTRLTPVERWHITMAFLGEIPDEDLPSVERAVTRAAGGGPIRLRLAGSGSFGRAVTWVGVEGDLGALYGALRRALDLPDDRPFTPHLTVSYHGSPQLRAALREYAGSSWEAAEIVLVRSADGYEKLRTWQLA